MSRDDDILRLLIIEDSIDEAEQLISQLRNGGIPLRPIRAEDEEGLQQALEQAPDLILINVASEKFALRAVVDAASLSGKDIGIVAYGHTLSADAIVAASQAGADAFAARDQPEHLRGVVRREYQALTIRRSARRLETALRESERRCDALLDSSRVALAYVHEGMHVRANQAYLDFFGAHDFSEIEGLSLLDLVAPAAADEFRNLLKDVRKDSAPPRQAIAARALDGTPFEAIVELSSASYDGEPCIQIVVDRPSPPTAHVHASDSHAHADDIRSKDLVTDLYNRRYTLTAIEHAVSAAVNGRTDQSLLLLELDHLKDVIDSIGIVHVDLLLGDVAMLLRQNVTATDLVGRLSDYTFGLVMTSRAASELRAFADSLRQAFENHIFEVGKRSISLTASMGGTAISEKNANADSVLGKAQEMLRIAQGEGGNRIALFDPLAKDSADSEKSAEWLESIQQALADDGFVLRYQPIISLQGSANPIYEILLRLATPKGEVHPGIFLPVAEANGLLPAVDRWVIAKAIRTAKEREDAGQKTMFFVKLSPPSLEDPTLIPWISQQLKSARLTSDALVFEMPESKIVTNLKPAREFLKGLEAIRCTFALEQFGLGLNSFQLLKHVPARYLKIDRHYMARLPENKENQEKIREICDQAKHAGKLTIAEFVEDAASMSILFACGVNFVQGNFLREAEKVMAYEF
ncbi:MAG: EAL domain-containing protein [Dokdonella sp.]